MRRRRLQTSNKQMPQKGKKYFSSRDERSNVMLYFFAGDNDFRSWGDILLWADRFPNMAPPVLEPGMIILQDKRAMTAMSQDMKQATSTSLHKHDTPAKEIAHD